MPQPTTRKKTSGCLTIVLVAVGVWGIGAVAGGFGTLETGGGFIVVLGLMALAVPGLYVWSVASAPAKEQRRLQQAQEERQRQAEAWSRSRPAVVIARDADPMLAAQVATRQRNGCAFLGLDAADREWVVAERQQAVLVLGPPRSGKTSSLIIPSILNASGPVVSTSTKAEVLRATARARSRMGRIWLFDPSGTEELLPGVLELHWSPIWGSRTWDGARAMADAMVGASSASEGVENGSYWSESAKALLAPLLHAAAISGKNISDVRRWVTRGEVADAGRALDAAGAESAADDLDAIQRTEERERSSIYSSTRIVLTAYGSDEAARRSRLQNFDAEKFVRSNDTVYIAAPSHLQTILAPLVAGLLEEIRDATYRLARTQDYSERQNHPVMWALDEVANIAPLKNLPGIVSEAGGQGLQVMACLQDLSQAKQRWGAAADGFLSLFGTKVIFPGIGDKATLESLSMMVGDWDRPYTVYNTNTGRTSSYGVSPSHGNNSGEGWTYSTQRESQISPSEIANIAPGHALLVRSGHWTLVETVPYYSGEPWRSALERVPAAIEQHGGVDELRMPRSDAESRAQHPAEEQWR